MAASSDIHPDCDTLCSSYGTASQADERDLDLRASMIRM
jgi:hypothetical protein